MALSDFDFENPSGTNSAPKWMLTFADLLSLILTFFIMIYAMSSTELNEWKAISGSIKDAFNKMPGIQISTEIKKREDTQAEYVKEKVGNELGYLNSVLLDKFNTAGIKDDLISVNLSEDRLVISLVGETCFANNSAVLLPKAQEIVEILGNALGSSRNRIEIYGNASIKPVNTPDYPSNLELSLARAMTAANKLKSSGYDHKIVAFGRSSANTMGLESLPKEQREGVSRRIDIIVRPFIKNGLN
jgi:chemotaxis protein MotB